MEKRRNRSLFWPIILVGVGVVWLLHNLGLIDNVNIGSLLRLWPLVLILLGLDILVGRRTPWAGAVIGVLAIAGVIVFLVTSPALGIETGTQVKTEVFSVPLEQTGSATYNLETSSDKVNLFVLNDSNDLINATVKHTGVINFNVSGATEKTVRLSQSNTSDSWFIWDMSFEERKWDIGLSSEVPSEINLDGGSGAINADLDGLQLNSLTADLGSGASTFILPKSESAYEVNLNSGSGAVSVTLAENTDVLFTLDSGSGAVRISLPDDVGLRIEVMDSGSGSLNLPNGLERVPGGSAFSADVYQTVGFDKSAHQITIKIAGQGSGSITIN